MIVTKEYEDWVRKQELNRMIKDLPKNMKKQIKALEKEGRSPIGFITKIIFDEDAPYKIFNENK